MYTHGNFDDRLQEWYQFRQKLENIEEPFLEILNFYNAIPLQKIQYDPWNRKDWPNPWDLLNANTYCLFSIVLIIAYTIRLTDRFSNTKIYFYIIQDIDLSNISYCLQIDDNYIFYSDDKFVYKKTLPNHFSILETYTID